MWIGRPDNQEERKMRYARVECECRFKAEATGPLAQETIERAARIHRKRCAAVSSITLGADAAAARFLAEVRS